MGAFEVCQLFLVPSAIFFGALAVARTEALKAAVSLLAFVMNIVWIAALLNVPVNNTNFRNACLILASLFLIAWFVCLFVHGVLAIAGASSEPKWVKLTEWLRKFDGEKAAK